MKLSEKENRRLRRIANERKRAVETEEKDFNIMAWMVGAICALFAIGIMVLIASEKK